MLNSVLFGPGEYRLIDPRGGRFPGANTFTVVIGKNGTGKSRLLRSIAIAFLEEVGAKLKFADRDAKKIKNEAFFANWQALPSRVIAVSTSPFDRFPILRSANQHLQYKYLGLRGLPSTNLGVTYLSKILGTLLEATTRRPETADAISRVLDYLGYEPHIEFEVQFAPASVIDRLQTSDGRNRTAFMVMEWSNVLRFWETSTPAQREILERIMNEHDWSSRKRAKIVISPTGVHGLTVAGRTELEMLLMIQAGLVKMSALSMRKKRDGTEFNVSDASSGEQAVVMSLLGIGSQIEDGALVLIDEPEVCLHPEWQEKYIHLLFETFSQYRGCHFIIATHSPQIVAELPRGNCFVLAMEDQQLHRAAEFSGRSVDFQLASLFNAPGHKNEYLLRMAVGVFADLSKGIELDQEGQEALNVFEAVVESLRDSDPVKDLISAVLELAGRHG